jgi:site-specific DNA recombinase
MPKMRRIEPPVALLEAKKKVAAYARVSVDTERLQHSLSAQISYYSALIQKNPEWEYAGVYADEGITGTCREKRDDFMRMLSDCEAGKIDIILTKSISRFARNTVDLLETVRHLKELGIEVRFEEQSISTFSNDGELMLTILASFAQEESRSISDNVKWATRKRFEKGIPNGKFRIFGYRWEEDRLVIVPEEAAIVRRIFQNFLDGKSRLETEREFAAEGITTANGCRWVDSNIKVVLTNITYTGNLLLQKEYIEDPISKHRKKNRGELQQYYVEDNHEPIIDMETFVYVQEEMARRKELGALANKSLNISCFTGKIKCGNCGCSFMHNTRKNRAKSTSQYGDMYTTWGCGTKKKKGSSCHMKEIPETILKQVCASVLELDVFDETVFSERVERIDVPEDYTLVFHFTDGSEKTAAWKSTAKQDCWTDEYKDQQREWVRNYMAQDDTKFTPFTTRMRCGVCGGPLRRATQPSRTAPDGKQKYWRCTTAAKCDVKGIREEVLEQICAGVLGIPEFDGDVFRERVDHIDVFPGGRLEFHLTDGSHTDAEYSTKRKGTPWSEEQRTKFKESVKKSYTPERRQAMSENMKRIRAEKHWSSKGGGNGNNKKD